MRLVLRERGTPVAVSPADWRNLRLEETVGTLANSGILRIERTSAAVILTPRNFVGEMHAPNVSLTILPKDQALYEAMLGLAVQFDGKDAHHHSQTSLAENGEDLATYFVDSLAAALESGLPWQYISLEEKTSYPRGKLRMGKTVSEFFSKGVLHRVVAARHERRQVRDFVNVVWAAYRSLPIAPGSTQPLVARASLLIEAFDDQDVFDISKIVSGAIDYLQNDKSEFDAARNLVKSALAILDYESGAGHSILFVPAGVARFSNLERVWERAVALLVSRALRSEDFTVAIHGLGGQGLKLFGDAGPTINPDVTAISADGSVALVADAKYKILSEGEFGGIASDVYQITCYVNRTRPQRGFLVYLGSKDRVTTLGKVECGAHILVICISPETLQSCGHDALIQLLGAG